MPKPYGTPGSTGYVNPFATKTPEPDAAAIDPIKEKYNAITEGINAYKSSQKTAEQKPAEEPAVVSSEGAQERVDAAHTKIAEMSKKGTTVGEDGSATYADGSLVPAPQGATYDEASGQYKYDGKTYGAAPFYDENKPDEDYAAITKLFAPLKQSLDADTLGQVNAIEQQFNGYRALAEDINQRAQKTLSRSLTLGGSARFAPMTKSGLSMNQAYLGLSKIQALDAKENMAIAQAKAAQTDGDFKLMTEALSMAEGIRKEKQAHAGKVMDAIDKANEDLHTQRMEIDRDEAVAKLMAAGTTDPAALMQKMKENGQPITASDLAKSIKNLTPTKTDEKALFKFTNDDVGKMFAVGMTAPLIQKVQDYYNGVDEEIPDLTPAQQAAVQKVLSGVVPKTENAGGFTPTQKLQLEQAGLANAPRQDQLDFLFGKDSQDDYKNAKQFVEDNPDATYEELNSALHENTKLSVSDINAILEEKGITKETTSLDGMEDKIATALVKSQGFMGDAEKAKEYIASAKELKINGKMVKISARQKEAIKAAIDAAYPGGKRSLLQSIVPGGK